MRVPLPALVVIGSPHDGHSIVRSIGMAGTFPRASGEQPALSPPAQQLDELAAGELVRPGHTGDGAEGGQVPIGGAAGDPELPQTCSWRHSAQKPATSSATALAGRSPSRSRRRDVSAALGT